MTIANVNPPIITPRILNLGEVFDGEYYSKQLFATELNPYAVLTWTISAGALPTGLTLSNTGLISGFIYPLATQGTGSNVGYNANPFNEYGYENSPSYQIVTYKFTVKVFDGANYDSFTYQLKVNPKGEYTADNTIDTIDDTYLTIDTDNVYVPIMITPNSLPEARSNTKFAFQFQAIDPADNQIAYALGLSSSGPAGYDENGTQGYDSIGFDQQNLSLPPGLALDGTTGWLSGTIGPQVESVLTYTFQVYAFETLNTQIQSTPVTYTLTTLGDITNYITWTTSANLGVIDNGTISDLSVTAKNNAGHALTYSLISDGSSLPQGLELQSSGLITGRTGFQFFSLDGSSTTIDGKISDFDNNYSFNVQAMNVDGTASSQQTFTILVNNFNLAPYENIYLKALPSMSQRQTFLNIVNNTDIFPEALIYRSTDPNFGRARDIRSLFLAGLSPTAVSTYMSAMGTNTYNKRIEFGDVKTAIAVDENFNTKYEVVYIELKDDATYNGNSPSNSKLDSVINKTVYPNSFANMSSVIVNAAGYENQGAIPDWMTSPQANKKVLGFTRAIVLAYTVPGASNLIAYRMGANGISFNSINFVLDRYDLDNSYSSDYNTVTDTYTLGTETTFDRFVRPSAPTVVSATYGVTKLAFNMINGQTVSQINARGGIDGVTSFANGDTVVFLQQESYPGETGLYDGWTNPGLIPGYTEFTNSVKIANGTPGFPTNPYYGQVALVSNVYYMFVADMDNSGNILDTVWKVANLRANIWTINIDSNNNVTLTPATFSRFYGTGFSRVQITTSMIELGDYVQINKGDNNSGSVVFYDPSLKVGHSVPAYTTVTSAVVTADKITKFDEYGTRFINNRIAFELPEVNDTWLKFPNAGPLL
jgi:hypothetical protein